MGVLICTKGQPLLQQGNRGHVLSQDGPLIFQNKPESPYVQMVASNINIKLVYSHIDTQYRCRLQKAV